MALPSLRSLLEVGAHVGHKKAHSHPATRHFVFTIKDGLYVMNMEKTIESLEAAIKFLKGVMKDGGAVLFVGTKPQAHEAVKKTAVALGQPYVSERWLGGTLTNFETVKKSLFQLQELEKKINDPSFETLRKRERLHLKEKHRGLTAVFEGMLQLSKIPDAMFVVDSAYEDIAVAEARRLGVPVVALSDTNANPDLVTYVIPANDESKRAVELILGVIVSELSGTKAYKKETAGVKAKPVAKLTPKKAPAKRVAKKPTRPLKATKQKSKPVRPGPARKGK